MPTTVTHKAAIRSGPLDKEGVIVLQQNGSFDPTSTSAVDIGVVLPKGAIVYDVISDGGATGGTNPTVDIGWSSDTDALANELDADGKSSALAAGTTGASVLSALSSDQTITGIAGAAAAAGGTVGVTIIYSLDPDTMRDASAE